LNLLDTNTIVHYIKGNPGVVARFHASSPGDLAVPSIVVYELEHGTLRASAPRRRTLITAVLHDLDVVPFDGEAALEAARIHSELETTGTPIGPMDLLIAGIARCRRATLITNNVNEFSRVKDLRIDDWRS
jgi:tRNA(fMet)-specific endonuclease VapC